MICSPKFFENSLSKAIKDIVGDDDVKFYSYIGNAIEQEEFKDEFKTWYENKYKKKASLKNKRMMKQYAQDIIDYYQESNHSVNDTFVINGEQKQSYDYRLGYTNFAIREEGKIHSGIMLLNEYKRINDNGVRIRGNHESYYFSHLKDKWKNKLFEILLRQRLGEKKITAMSKEDIAAKFQQLKDEAFASGNEILYLEQNLKDKDSAKIKNSLAVLKELYSTRGKAYFDSVISTKKLQPLFNDIDPEIAVDNDVERAADEEAANSQEGNNGEKQEDLDMFISNVTNHIGSYSDFNTHVTERIKIYFNTLPVMLDYREYAKGEYVLDTNNTFGEVNYMNDTMCSQMMYRLEFNNLPQMIDQIKRTARNNPEFRAFGKFAKDLEDNPDFATEVATVYMKTNMPRLETVTQAGQNTTHISNERADARNALFYDMLNDYRDNVINVDNETLHKQILPIFDRAGDRFEGTIVDKMDLFKIRGAKDRTFDIFHAYFPSVSYNSFILYIENANGASINEAVQSSNLRFIANNLYTLITRSSEAIQKYQKNQEHKKRIRERVASKHSDDEGRVNTSRWMNYATEEDIAEYYAQDAEYVPSGLPTRISEIVNEILPFSSVKTDLNARNVYGNNSSSVINNSRMTWLANMLKESVTVYKIVKTGEIISKDEFESRHQSEDKKERLLRDDVLNIVRNPILEKWGAEMIKSNQYQHIPYFLNKPGLPGIFDYKDGILTIARGGFEAISRMKISLFDGASNMDGDKHATYSDMTEGDFLPVAYTNFHHARFETSFHDDEDCALFFPRTPSDAPKTFVFKMPRLSTGKMLDIHDNKYQINQLVSEGIETKDSSVVKIDFKNYNNEGVIVTNSNAIEKIYNGEWEYINIKRGNVIKKNSDGTFSVLMIEPNAEFGRNSFYSIKGKYEKVDGKDVLTNPKIEAVYNKHQFSFADLPAGEKVVDRLNALNESQDIEYKGVTIPKQKISINTNTEEYEIFKGIFKQELIDAYTAMEHYFTLTKTGKVKCFREEGSPLKKAIKPALKAGVSENSGYKFYHLGSDGNVFEQVKDESGLVVGYRLGGNVFHSSKFTCNVTDANGNVRTVNFMDEMFSEDSLWKDKSTINLLYGRAINDVVIRDKDGVIRDVNLTEEQESRLAECMQKFIQAKIDHIAEEMRDYKSVIPERAANPSYADFTLNYFLFYNASDMLLEGSTKFYKDNQTVLKRAKEGQGSGTPYGISNPLVSDMTPSSEIEHSYLNDGTYESNQKDENGNKIQKSIQSIFVEAGIGEIKQRTKFRAITIKNTQTTNHPALKALVNQLVKESGLSEESATTLLYGPIQLDKNGNPKIDKTTGQPIRRGGFTETKVNDAQSYITFEEWVRRIAARGQLQKHLPLIRKLLDPNVKIPPRLVKEFIQVQKNFYYDIHRDEEFGIDVPRQIKNAEFVLVPKFIKGTELEAVYNMMKKAGIDQLNTVETSKAANRELLTIWDNDEQLVKEMLDTESKEFGEFCSKASAMAQDYSYNNLYTQQETPQHMDSTNKAGIQIMKKMLDNVSDDNAFKKDFFKQFTENIRSSSVELLEDLNVPLTKDGSIDMEKFDNLPYETKKNIYQRFARELYRRGMDSNLKDYITLDETGTPLMPTIMSNNINILEQSVQSIFNSAITRQKLPGFHAAQITNVGFRTHEQLFSKFEQDVKENGAMSENGIDNVTYNKHLQYHPLDKNGRPQPYIEVMLPASYLGIDMNSRHYKERSMKDILKEIQDKKLDELIGYRIPTEGKQSICIMKVVGLLSNEQGSTIVVPNDWVTQTGSDFDIDSIYGINYHTNKKYDGEVVKVEYKEDDFNIYDYAKWISSKTKTKGLIKSISKEYYEKINEEANAAFVNLLEKAYNQKTQINIKKFLRNVHQELIKINGGDNYQTKIDYNNEVMAVIENQYRKQKDAIKKFPRLQKMFDNVSSKFQILYDYLNENYSDIKSNESDSEFSNILKDQLSAKAVENGLPDFETYLKESKANPEKYNTKNQRDSRILDDFMSILKDPANLEENLSRSNFDKISEALQQTMNMNVKIERNGRSAYDVIDQIRYQEDAMSGYALKAFSVSLDTFCSICNTVKPTLTKPIKIVYNSTNDINADSTSQRFSNPTTIVDKKSKSFLINHSQYGWSNDNRNVDNMILTSYSSQTTAYILDAIKEGAIPNVNFYTFPAFKTLANIGCNYTTSVPFIMQPGIGRIAKHYKVNKSIYSQSNINPIDESIKDIARELGFKVDYKTSIAALLKNINEKYNSEFNEIFNIGFKDPLNISEANPNIPIIQQRLLDRLSEKGMFDSSSPVERKLLFDLGTILTFANLNNVAKKISSLARCCNPDKFGAKQTVFSTNKVFDDILSHIDEKTPVLTVNNQPFLQAIYPGAENGLDAFLSQDRIEESKYKSMYAFLKYSTGVSIKLARQVLDTQSKEFVNLVSSIVRAYSGEDANLDEKTYNEYQRHCLNYFYNNAKSIKNSISYDAKNKHIVIDLNSNTYNETQRIYGFNRSANIEADYLRGEDSTLSVMRRPFTVQDLSSPTQSEIDAFATMSPAQKIAWIKKNYSDPGIFGLINVKLFNGNNRGWRRGIQTIEYYNQDADANILYNEFDKAFYNQNPLIRLAAIDVIKYAVQVEGMRFSKNGVFRLISNNPLMDKIENGGLGFVDDVMNQMKNPANYVDETEDKILDTYLRQHINDFSHIRTFYSTKSKKLANNIKEVGFGMMSIAPIKSSSKASAEDTINEFHEKLAKMGIEYRINVGGQTGYISNAYIKFKYGKETTLYKIHHLGDEVLLTPMTPLMRNEYGNVSINPYNNKSNAYASAVYDKAVADYAENKENAKLRESVINAVKEFTDNGEASRGENNFQKAMNVKGSYLNFDINTEDNLVSLKNYIEDWLRSSDSTDTVKYVRSNPLGTSFIRKNGEVSNQTIKIDSGKYADVSIRRIDETGFNKYLRAAKKFPDKINIVKRDISNDKKIPEQVKKMLNEAIDLGYVSIGSLFAVEKQSVRSADESTMASNALNLESTNRQVFDYLNYARNSRNDENATYALERFKGNQIENNLDSLKENQEIVTREVANFAQKTAKQLVTDFNSFIPNPENLEENLAITDKRVLPLVRTSQSIRNKYLRTLNSAVGFKARFQHYFDFDAQSENSEIQHYLDIIKTAVNDIRELPVEEVNHNMCEEYFGAMSTNPLIHEQVIDVLENYWKLGGVTGYIHDIWESGDPIVQLVLKDVYGDIESKRMMTLKRLREFDDVVEKFKKKGIELKDVIDDTGQLIHDYSPEFVEKLYGLKLETNNAASEFGLGSIQHLKAKNEFDMFKAKHVNQEAKKEYYIEAAQMDAWMIKYHPRIFEVYKKLWYQRNDLYRSVDKDDETTQNKIAEINRQIYMLRHGDTYFDGENTRNRPADYAAATDPKRRTQAPSIYDVTEAEVLHNTLEKRSELDTKYFEYVDEFGFKDLLDKNLKIMDSFEQRDGNGIPTVPMNVLMQNKVYAEARDWVFSHARFKWRFENEQVTGRNSLKERLKKAYSILTRDAKNGKSSRVNSICTKANNNKGIKDEKGISNGRLLTDEERANVKEAMLSAYNIAGMPAGTDRVLISNAPTGSAAIDLYTSDFYARMSGDKHALKNNRAYLETITELNKILEKYYHSESKTLRLSDIPNTPEGIETIREIANLYQKIRSLKKQFKTKATEEQKEFIKNNVEFVVNKTLYRSELNAAKEKGSDYFNEFVKILVELEEDGSPARDFDTGKVMPNKMLFSFVKPKGKPGDESYDKWVDSDKKGALALLDMVYKKTKTEYYYQAMIEAQQRDYQEPGYYKKWYNDNHVYNPYNRVYEPLDCWVTYSYTDEVLNGQFAEGKPYGEWVSKDFGDKKVKDGTIVKDGQEFYTEVMDMRNHDYKGKDSALAENYVKGSEGGIYDNSVKLSDDQKELRDYIQDTLSKLAQTESAKKYFSKGYLPAYRKGKNPTAKDWVKEMGKMLGLTLENNSIGYESYYDEIGYNRDITPLMPGLKQLRSSKPITINNDNVEGLEEALNSYETINYKVTKPENAEEYEQWKANRLKVAEHNRKISQALIDNDWNTIIPKFIEAAGRFNAVLENKEKLYQVLETLKNQRAYLRKYDMYGKLKKIDRNEENDNAYATAIDNDLIKQYETFIRRLLWEQFKKPEGHYTRLLSRLQGFTSANYMMLNVKGGVANVTVGLQGIMAEANAGEYFGWNEFRAGMNEYRKGMISYLSNLYSEKAYTKQDAAIKFFKAVDYDEITGICEKVGMEKWSERLRNAAFSPQSSGEHFMQNSVLLGMLKSHRVMFLNDDKFGIGAVAVNRNEYRNIKMSEYLNEILTDEQLEKFAEFKNGISKDKQKAAEYAWWRKDLLTEFVTMNCTRDQIKEYVKKKKAVKEKLDKQFDELNDLYSQLELKNGYLDFKEGSDLANLNEQLVGDGSSNVTKAVYLLGQFSNRVKKVNNKIHGVYNKMGRAQIEQNWWGSVVMQYHKHLPMGILKRYRSRGFYDETRGTVEKGIFATMKDFFSLNARRIKQEAGFTEENVRAIESVQFWAKNGLKFLTTLNDTKAMLPEYDLSNMRRQLGDFLGVAAGLLTSIALYPLHDDWDDSVAYNFAIYEADRLASESFMYNLVGLYSEGKTLFSTPVAAQSIVTDCFNAIYQIIGFIMQGEEFQNTYKSGRFAGENKIGVYVQRRIPMWSAVRNIIDLPSNNQYYKIGGKPLNFVDTEQISDLLFN